MGLFLFCMGEKEIGFTGYELLYRHFLDADEDVAITHIFFHFYTCFLVFLVWKAPFAGALHYNPHAWHVFVYPAALRGHQCNPVIRRSFSFPDQADFEHIFPGIG
jgi:hypothetical protein